MLRVGEGIDNHARQRIAASTRFANMHAKHLANIAINVLDAVKFQYVGQRW